MKNLKIRIISKYKNDLQSELSQIQAFFNTEYPLNQEGLKELFGLFKVEKVAKGEMLLAANTTENYLRFLNSGVVREYYATPDKETNINFYAEPQFITDLSSFINNISTNKNQECITEVELLSVEKSAFRKLLDNYECGKSFIEISFQRLLKQKELFEYNRITKTADELYKELIIYRSNWLDNIPQYHIASYLNVTPETLSRIRKRIS
ncbi:Crp/Fnr family transcriptional regulator [Tenacibaculum mesophilum]|uniref:Crp/Fnr family transcriptional regulator n=1 Tax=Tenacibaculum mesophilum TaxID=104268 RepID=A0AAE9MRI1_9FLAO|nr:Crp/Fnr family transcriptional regulator [Tenacibaculum mesophilum]